MKLLVLAFFASLCCAQSFEVQPTYMVAMGGAYNTASAAPTASGWVSYDIDLGNGYYSVTTANTRQASEGFRTGFAKDIVRTGNTRIVAFVDAGINTDQSATKGAFSGGGAIVYDLAGMLPKLRGKWIFAVLAVRMLAVDGKTKPQYEFGLGKGF